MQNSSCVEKCCLGHSQSYRNVLTNSDVTASRKYSNFYGIRPPRSISCSKVERKSLSYIKDFHGNSPDLKKEKKPLYVWKVCT
jgi:hypothetical protein